MKLTYKEVVDILKDNGFNEESLFPFLKFVVNYKVKFTKALNASYHGNVFCPFHADIQKPSAKIYNDPKGERLYCFAESKLYFPVDYISMIKGYDYKEVALKILDRLSIQEIKSMLLVFKSDSKFIEKDFSTLQGFRNKEFDFNEFVHRLQSIIFEDE